jgi:hypothetical protein
MSDLATLGGGIGIGWQTAHEWIDVRLDKLGLVRIGHVEHPHVYPWSTVLRIRTRSRRLSALTRSGNADYGLHRLHGEAHGRRPKRSARQRAGRRDRRPARHTGAPPPDGVGLRGLAGQLEAIVPDETRSRQENYSDRSSRTSKCTTAPGSSHLTGFRRRSRNTS